MKASPGFELRLLTAALLTIVLIVASCQNLSIAQEKSPMEGTVTLEGRQDFDFLVGDWEAANRRLKQRPATGDVESGE